MLHRIPSLPAIHLILPRQSLARSPRACLAGGNPQVPSNVTKLPRLFVPSITWINILISIKQSCTRFHGGLMVKTTSKYKAQLHSMTLNNLSCCSGLWNDQTSLDPVPRPSASGTRTDVHALIATYPSNAVLMIMMMVSTFSLAYPNYFIRSIV
jgi:hypothetical protein